MKQQPPGAFKKAFGRFATSLQRLGKSLMFPIAILPAAAILVRLGALLTYAPFGHPFMENDWLWWIGTILQAPGAVVFNNIAIVFAIGVGFGFAKDFRGECALVAGIAFIGLELLMGNQGAPKNYGLPYLFYHNLLTFKDPSGKLPGLFSHLLYTPGAAATTAGGSDGVSPTYSFQTGVFGAIVTGSIVAWLYNRYKNVQLPQALSFFGGRRFIPMLGLATVIPLGFIFAAIWPWANYGLTSAGIFISNSGTSDTGDAVRFGAIFLYGLVNRLAQPAGLHHIINTFMWFQLPIKGVDTQNGVVMTVNGDITAFQKNIDTAGIFTTCFFPMFLGGLPGAAAAMGLAADKSKRRQICWFLFGVGTVSFLTGVDEPLAFLFIFVSPLLWIIHAFLTATLCGITTLFKMHIGFGFSAGLIDWLISLPQAWIISLGNYPGHNIPGAASVSFLSNPLWVWPLSALAFAMYFPTFYFLIKKLNIPTPGRESLAASADGKQIGFSFKEQEVEEKSKTIEIASNSGTKTKAATKKAKKSKRGGKKDYDAIAKSLIEIIGLDNIDLIENCATRLRLVVKDASKIDKLKVREISPTGLITLSKTAVQIVIGTDVEHVADIMKEITHK